MSIKISSSMAPILRPLFLFVFLLPWVSVAQSKHFNVDGFIVDDLLYDEEFFKKIEQPINFSHETHAGDNNISCEYCHSYAGKSINSGIPPVRTCMGCHAVILGSTEEQKNEIAKIKEYWEKGESIPWKKIHDLPDHARFAHHVHLNKGFDCTTCHGEVSKWSSLGRSESKGKFP